MTEHPISVRLSSPLVRALRSRASELGRPVSAVVRDAVAVEVAKPITKSARSATAKFLESVEATAGDER